MRFSLVSAVLVTLAAPVSAQSLLYRSPNLSGTWTTEPGVVDFNFLHRFYVTPGPTRTVTNFPTFTVAVGLPAHTTIGLHYATKSEVATTASNEFEFYGRWRRSFGAVALAVTPAYNAAAKSFDGEVGIDWTRGAVTLLGAVRGMSHAYRLDTARVALAAGVVLRLNSYVGLSGDVASLMAPRAGEDLAWSAGLVFAIPNSPHTFSLHASNATVNSIEGASRRSPLLATATNKPLYGFEFTVPLHLNRFAPWFKKSGAPSRASAGPAAAGTTDIRINNFKFADTLTIAVGQTVRWINEDPIDHTISFDGGEVASPPFGQGREFTHTFARAGTYTYHCTPHPFMRGTIVVR